MELVCDVCGGTGFADRPVLWDLLCSEWQLAPSERAYVDRQQGTTCTGCGSNLRSIALARAILRGLGAAGTLNDWVAGGSAASVRVLEINDAGTLTPTLRRLPQHRLATYPEIDIHALPYPDASFDIVVHSDTLEHVAQPVRALAECRRVLRRGGLLAFTVPTIVGRLSRNRAGLPHSFHGDAATSSPDFAVVTEYGADMWTHVVQAGFGAVTITAIDYPSALAMSAHA
jgi:SAM-dependent methyltransferase